LPPELWVSGIIGLQEQKWQIDQKRIDPKIYLYIAGNERFKPYCLCHTRIREVCEHCGQVGADPEPSAPNVFGIFVNEDIVKLP
jgi:hypothetical protein